MQFYPEKCFNIIDNRMWVIYCVPGICRKVFEINHVSLYYIYPNGIMRVPEVTQEMFDYRKKCFCLFASIRISRILNISTSDLTDL